MGGLRRPGANRRGMRGFGGAPAAAPTLAESILAAAPGLVQRMQLSPAPGTGLASADCYSLVGGKCERWIDLSGNGRDYLQATDAKRPTYSATAINSLPGLTVDGGDVLVTAAYDLSAYTWAAHITLYSTSSVGICIVHERSTNAASTAGGHYLSINETASTDRLITNGAGVPNGSRTSSRTLSTAAVVTGTSDQALAAAESRTRVNGVDDTTVVYTGDASGGHGAALADHIGGRGATPSLAWTGAVAADVLLGGTGGLGAPQLAQVAAIEALLISTWSVS